MRNLLQDEDSPKDAQAAESKEAKEGEKSSEGEGDKAIAEKTEPTGEHDQKEQPRGSQTKEDSSADDQETPSDLGQARSESQVSHICNNAPINLTFW